MKEEHPFFLAGKWRTSAHRLDIFSPYDGAQVGTTFLATEADLEQAIQQASAAFAHTRRLSSYQRATALQHLLEMLRQREQELVRLIVLEAGKPWQAAQAEVQRAFHTIETAAEEAKRVGGELLPMDVTAPGQGMVGMVGRFPIGPVAAITPFNFPLNLALHKLAPAIAVGNPIVIKPSPRTPLTLLALAEMVARLDLPPGAVSIMPLSNELAARMAADDRFSLLSFTGSAAVGWDLKARAGKKRVMLELGGNAAVIVCPDADVADAIPRIVQGGYAFAGQSCISVQRVYVHVGIYEDFLRRLVPAVKALRVGDPLSPDTEVGPLIDEAAVQRTEAWCREAVAEGARLVVGGQRLQGHFFEPTVLAEVNPESKVCAEEVFAPVLALFPFSQFPQAVAMVNDSRYGLQAGVFTRDLENILYAFQGLQVGGVVINEVPTFRLDHMPYGGVKDSGLGREGVRYAIQEMTELKLLAIRRREGPG